MIKCANPACNAPMLETAKFCRKCGTVKAKAQVNICENKNCINYDNKSIFTKDDRYCDECGQPTTIGKIIENLI